MGRFRNNMRGPEAVAALNALDEEMQALKGGGQVGSGTPAVLSPPTGVAASGATSNGMTLTWNAVAGSYGYNVYRGGSKVNSSVILGLAYNDAGLAVSTQYSWTIKTLNSAGLEGAASATVTATTSPAAVSPVVAPASLAASSPTASAITLTWPAVSGAIGYNVYRGTTKVNSSALVGLTFTDSGLNASTLYSYTVRALNSVNVEGPASVVASVTTLAAAGSIVSGIAPMPNEVAAIYFEGYDATHHVDGVAYNITDVPLDFNVIYLFNMQPAGTPAAGASRDNLGDGTFQMSYIGLDRISVERIRTVRARGQKIIVTAGGAGAGFNFDSRARSQNFLRSFYNIVDQLGGVVDGIDWNTFEAYLREVYKTNPATVSTNTTELVWISQQLRNTYGPNFAVTLPPAPNAFGANAFSPYDSLIAATLNNAGLLTYAAPQFYDTASVKTAGLVATRIAQWVDHLGASKVVVGTSHGNRNGNFTDCLTTTEWIREANAVLSRDPSLRGWYLWSMHDKVNATASNFISEMRSRFGSSPLVPLNGTSAPVGNQSAVDAGFAYLGGQNGAWLDPTANYLRSRPEFDSAGVTAGGQQFGRIVDRSANDNDIYAPTGTPNLGTYDTTGGKSKGILYAEFNSDSGGGSLQNPSNGFFVAMAVGPRGYYSSLWTDSTGPNNGRFLYYNPDENGIVFSVGTGTAPRRTVKVVDLGTQYQSSTANMTVKAWHDMEALTINLQVNDGPVASAACPSFSPGGSNYQICARNPVTSVTSMLELYQSVHIFNKLTSAMRDGIGDYVAGKLP